MTKKCGGVGETFDIFTVFDAEVSWVLCWKW